MVVVEVIGACLGILGCIILGRALSRIARDVNKLAGQSPDVEEVDRPAYGIQWGLMLIALAFAAIIVSRIGTG